MKSKRLFLESTLPDQTRDTQETEAESPTRRLESFRQSQRSGPDNKVKDVEVANLSSFCLILLALLVYSC